MLNNVFNDVNAQMTEHTCLAAISAQNTHGLWAILVS